jgi:hypothetical protein
MNSLLLSRSIASKINWDSAFTTVDTGGVEYKISDSGGVFAFGAEFLNEDAYYALVYTDVKKVMVEKGSVLIQKAKKEKAASLGIKIHLKNIGELVLAMLSDDEYMTGGNIKKIFYEVLHLLKASVVGNLLSYAEFGDLFKYPTVFGHFAFNPSPSPSWLLTIPYKEKMPSKIIIKASELAACIGKNPYKKPDEVLNEMWKKYSPETFTGETTDDRNMKAVKASPQTRALFYQVLKMKPANSDEVAKAIEETLEKVGLDPNLTKAQKKDAGEHMRKMLSTHHGTRSEAKTADQDEEKLEIDNSFHTYKVGKFGDIEFEIVGKIDRLQVCESGEKILVEIKNRARCLFGEVKEYEYLQVQTYLQMLGLKRGRLTEQFNQERRHYPIERDDELWNTEIMPKLTAYCERVHAAIFSSEGF